MELLNIHHLLFNFIKKNSFTFISYMTFTIILYPIHFVLIPDYYGMVINSFKDKSNLFVYYVKMLLGAYIVSWLLEALVLFIQYKLTPNFSEYATGTIFEFILNNYELDFENIHTGEILSKIIRMPGILFEYVDVFRLEFLKELFVLLTAIYKYIKVSYTATFAYIFFIVINYIYMYVMFNIFSKYNIETNKLQDRMYEYLVDCFNNLSSVYAFNQKENEMERFYNFSFKGYKNIMTESLLTFIKGDLFWGVVTLALFIVMNSIIYNAYLNKEINAELLVSTFVVTFSIIRLYEKSESSSHKLASVFSQIKDSETFFNQISTYNFNHKKTNKHKFRNGDIVFKGINHKYENTYVLQNINITINKGEKVALIGQIGSGKSTLIKLLLGFQQIVMGSITIDGIDINDIPNEEIRNNIFYIPQKPKLFNRTLYENIIYGLEKPPSKESILKLLDDFNLNDIRETFAIKMDETVGVDGNSLSGGQRQIVWLLRSFYRQCRILVLDEPTASLDPENKQIMISIIKKISIGKTVIIISHDNIDPMFRKIELKQGRLVSSSFFD
jgi:ABC-type multidrug transport system fused ATPase/permease subunit